MKNVPIKFRAKANGKYYYGDFERCYENRGDDYLGKEYYCIKFPMKNMNGRAVKVGSVRVDYNSISQLIGYDSKHNEVYEDDILVDKQGHCIKAGLIAFQPERIWDLMMTSEFEVARDEL